LVTASQTKKHVVDSTVSGKRRDGALISTGSGARSASAVSADARPLLGQQHGVDPTGQLA